MKPKNLKSPYSWEERKPLIRDRVLYVPEHYEKHHAFDFPGWDHPSLFGQKGNLFIEFCTGNGAWIIERARNEPQNFWIVVEQRFDRVKKIWSKIHNYNLNNLVVVSGEALTFSKYYLHQ